MYKILVVDEEQSFIDSVKEIIDKKIELAKVIAEATTGRQAVDKARRMKPDIILLDVKISGINGLEAIKVIREFLPNVHIIIVSAYDYYGFLREAIRLNVDDYILKPLNRTNFIDVLNRIIIDIQKEEEVVKVEYENQLIINDAIQITEQNFIYSVLFKGGSEQELEWFQNLLGIGNSGFVLNIDITSRVINPVQDMNKEWELYYQCIKIILNQLHYNSVIGPRILNRMVLFITKDIDNNDSIKQKADMIKLAQEIQQGMKKELDVEIRIGIGSVELISDLYKSYEESIHCLTGSNEEDIVHISDLAKEKNVDYKEYIELESKLLESIKLVKDEMIDIFCTLLESIKTLEIKWRKNKVFELFVLSCHATRTYNKNENEYFNYLEIQEEIKYISANEIDTWALKKFQLIIKAIRASSNDKVSSVVSMALKYIEEHYKEELSLEEVSRHVSVSPQYLSKLFKEETNSNFVEYTTRLRIEKAKDLMNSTDKTIKEICFLVGYHDPNYFSRKFKSIVGISPTDYLKGKEVVLY